MNFAGRMLYRYFLTQQRPFLMNHNHHGLGLLELLLLTEGPSPVNFSAHLSPIITVFPTIASFYAAWRLSTSTLGAFLTNANVAKKCPRKPPRSGRTAQRELRHVALSPSASPVLLVPRQCRNYRVRKIPGGSRRRVDLSTLAILVS